MLTLAPIVASFQQTIEKLDETSNLSVAELEELGVPADMHEKIREIGAQRISMIKQQLEIDLKWLTDIAEDQKYIPVLAVPQEKFAQFLIEDFEESLSDIQERRWFHRCRRPKGRNRPFRKHPLEKEAIIASLTTEQETKSSTHKIFTERSITFFPIKVPMRKHISPIHH